jgi:hypothetical protein
MYVHRLSQKLAVLCFTKASTLFDGADKNH